MGATYAQFASAMLDAIAMLQCACGAAYDGRGIVMMSSAGAKRVIGWRCDQCERKEAHA